jgi:hypothetical protein
MKEVLGLLLALAVAVSAQGPTVTDGLMSAQAELALSHRFFEETVFRNRVNVSAYLKRINEEIIDSHITTYGFIKTLGLDTLAEIEGFDADEDQQSCIDNVLERWNLQKIR